MATYKELIEHNPNVASLMPEDMFDAINEASNRTGLYLQKEWDKHFRRNMKTLYKRYGLISENLAGFGTNKAVIMIGAGPSFNLNKQFLKNINHWNAQLPVNQQPFIFVACNHQYKPCLNMGIIPHFVLLVDSSNVVMDQLCKDIPARGQHVTLVTSLRGNPKVLKEWDKQGRKIQFYLGADDKSLEQFKEFTGKDGTKHQVVQGGNVMNVCWSISMALLNSKTFICVGNDLSFPLVETAQESRDKYYADGDYSTNLGTRRDEASKRFKWLGFEICDGIITPEPYLKFVHMGTAPTLFRYKKWIETYVAVQDMAPYGFHYYNCSESGILGVVPKSYEVEDLDKKENWTLMDEFLPRRWHTTTLKQAVSDFLAAREAYYGRQPIRQQVTV